MDVNDILADFDKSIGRGSGNSGDDNEEDSADSILADFDESIKAAKPKEKPKEPDLGQRLQQAGQWAKQTFIDPVWAASQREVEAMRGHRVEDTMLSRAAGQLFGPAKAVQDIYNTAAGALGLPAARNVERIVDESDEAIKMLSGGEHSINREAFRVGNELFPNLLPAGGAAKTVLGKTLEGAAIGAGQNVALGPGQEYAATGKAADLQRIAEMALEGGVSGGALGGAAGLLHAAFNEKSAYQKSEDFVNEQAKMADLFAKLRMAEEGIALEGRAKVAGRPQYPGLPGEVKGRVIPPGEALTAPDDYTFKGRPEQELPALPPTREDPRLRGQYMPMGETIPMGGMPDPYGALLAKFEAEQQMAMYGPELRALADKPSGRKPKAQAKPVETPPPAEPDPQMSLPEIPEKITLPDDLSKMTDADVERIGSDAQMLDKMSPDDVSRLSDEYAKRTDPAYKEARMKEDWDGRMKKRSEGEARGTPTFLEDHHGTNIGRGLFKNEHLDAMQKSKKFLSMDEYGRMLPSEEKWNPAELSDQELAGRRVQYLKRNEANLPPEFSSKGRIDRLNAVEAEIARRRVAGISDTGSIPEMPKQTVAFRDQLKKAVNIPDEQVDAVSRIVDSAVYATARKRGVTPASLYEKFSIEKGHADGNKGITEFYKDTGKAAMKMAQGADVSTVLHEFGHVARRHLLEPDELRIVERELAVRDGKWNESAEEAYARMFERYMHDGKTPNAGLKPVFERIKSWMMDIYKTLKGSDIDRYISSEMQKHFDRLLGDDQKALTRGEDVAKERMRDAVLGDERHNELARLRREYLQLKPEVKDNRPTRSQQKQLMEKFGVEEVGTGESLRFESRLVDGEGNHIRDYEMDKIEDPKRFKAVQKRIAELNKAVAGELAPGERKTYKVGDDEYLVVSHDDRKRLEGGDVEGYKKALKDWKVDEKTADEVREVEKFAQSFPVSMQGSVVNNAIALVKNSKLATKVKQFTGTMTGLDWIGAEDARLKDSVVGHLGELIRIGKGLKVENDANFAVAAGEAMRMEPADIMTHNGWNITPEQRRYLADSKGELMSMADTLKKSYDQNSGTMSDGLKRVLKDMYEDITRGGNIETGKVDKNFEKSLLDKTVNQISGGLYDAVVTGNWHIHGLHLIDAALGAPATVGLKNAGKAVASSMFDPEVRKFNGSFGHESGLKKVVKANDPTFWDKHVTANVERFINQNPTAAKALKGAKLLEGGWLESVKMNYLRAAALEQVAGDMGMSVGDLAKGLNNNSLTPLQMQTAYASMFTTLNDAVGYVPNGFRDRFGMERSSGKHLSKFMKLAQPFMGMRQVQSRLLTKLLVDGIAEGDPRQLGKAGTYLATLFLLGGAAAIPKPVRSLVSEINPTWENELEEFLNETAPGPKVFGRTVEHIQPDIIPWMYGSYEGLERLKKEGKEGAQTVGNLRYGKMPTDHEQKNALKLMSYLAGGSNILGITSAWQIAQLKQKLGQGEEGEKDIYAYLNDQPFQNDPAGKEKVSTSQIKELMNFVFGAGVDNEDHEVRSRIAQWKRVENDLTKRYDRDIARQAVKNAKAYLQEHPDEKPDWDEVYREAEGLAE